MPKSSILAQATKALDAHYRQEEVLQKNLIKALFQEIPSLQSIEINFEEQYDDNNYYTEVSIAAINKFRDLPESISNAYDDGDEDGSKNFKSWLMQHEMSSAEIEMIRSVVYNLPAKDLESLTDGDACLRRKNFIKSAKTKKRKTHVSVATA